MKKTCAILLLGLVASVASADYVTVRDDTFNSTAGNNPPAGWTVSGLGSYAGYIWDSVYIKPANGALNGATNTTLNTADARKVRISSTVRVSAGTMKGMYIGFMIDGTTQAIVDMLADGAIDYGSSIGGLTSMDTVATFGSYATISVEMDLNTNQASVSVTDGANTYSTPTFAISGLADPTADTFTTGASFYTVHMDYTWQTGYVKNVNMAYDIPEPMTLSLLAVGGIFGIVRRRK